MAPEERQPSAERKLGFAYYFMKHDRSNTFYTFLLFLQPLNSLDRCRVSLWRRAGHKLRCLPLGLKSLMAATFPTHNGAVPDTNSVVYHLVWTVLMAAKIDVSCGIETLVQLRQRMPQHLEPTTHDYQYENAIG